MADEDYPDGRLANRAVKKLDELAKQTRSAGSGQGQPFFMAVGFFKPHLPFAAPKTYWDMYDRDKIPLSVNPDLPEGVDDSLLHSSKEFFMYYKGGREMGGIGKRVTDEYAREIIHGNFASITYMDAQVGKVLDKLKETGLDENTIVVVWGDHGWHLGDHTIWGKHSVFERALNSILMVKVPGMNRPGEATEALVASIDLYPTFCDLAKLPKPSGLDGKSFIEVVNDPEVKGKTEVVSFWKQALSMRTDRYRISVFNDGTQQSHMLFDHENDPNETKNIAHKHPELVGRLSSILKKKTGKYLPDFK